MSIYLLVYIATMNFNSEFLNLFTESEALDSWEDEVATTPEDEVLFLFLFYIHFFNIS